MAKLLARHLALLNIWLISGVLFAILASHPAFALTQSPTSAPTLPSPSHTHSHPFCLISAPAVPPLGSIPPTLAPLTMSRSSSADFVLPVTLHDEPRLRFDSWLTAVHEYARTLEPTIDIYGALYLVCDDVTWGQLRKNIITPAHDGMGPAPPPTIRPRPSHPPPGPPSHH